MTERNIFTLAKLGDVKAISSLINRSLQPKGITAKLTLKDNCLHILLESKQVPPKQLLFEFIRKGITSLNIASIKKLKVYGRQTGKQFPSWSQDFEFGSEDSSAGPSTWGKL
jgi:hypothetical protein